MRDRVRHGRRCRDGNPAAVLRANAVPCSGRSGAGRTRWPPRAGAGSPGRAAVGRIEATDQGHVRPAHVWTPPHGSPGPRRARFNTEEPRPVIRAGDPLISRQWSAGGTPRSMRATARKSGRRQAACGCRWCPVVLGRLVRCRHGRLCGERLGGWVSPVAPAACRCAQTTVLSTECSVRSGRPSASARR